MTVIQPWRGWGGSFTGRWGNPRPHFKFQVHPAYRSSLFSTPPTKFRCQQKWVQHPWEATVGRSTYTETLHTHGCDSWHIIPRDRQTCKGVLSDRNSRKRSWRLCCVQSEWNSAGKAIKPRVTHKESESRSADLGWRQFSRFSAQG